MIRSTALFAVLMLVFLSAEPASADGMNPAEQDELAMNSDASQAVEPVDPVIEEPVRPLYPDSTTSRLRATQCGSMQLLVPPLIVFLLSSMRLVSKSPVSEHGRSGAHR